MLPSMPVSIQRKLEERLRKKLPKAIEKLTTIIDNAGLDKLDVEITVALRYVHDDLKVMPKQLENLYQKVYAFAAAHPQEVGHLGRGVRQLLIRLRQALKRISLALQDPPGRPRLLQTKVRESVDAAISTYNESAAKALTSVIMPFFRKYPSESLDIFHALMLTDFPSIDRVALRKKLKKVAGKSKYAF